MVYLGVAGADFRTKEGSGLPLRENRVILSGGDRAVGNQLLDWVMPLVLPQKGDRLPHTAGIAPKPTGRHNLLLKLLHQTNRALFPILLRDRLSEFSHIAVGKAVRTF